MSSDGHNQSPTKRSTGFSVGTCGVIYGSGWPVFEIRTPWAIGCSDHNGDEQPEANSVGEPQRPLYSPEDVARILNISVRAVEQLVRKKKLGCIQLTKRKRAFTQELIDDFIRRQSGGAPARGDGAAKSDPLSQRAATKPLPVEEARALLKKVMKRT